MHRLTSLWKRISILFVLVSSLLVFSFPLTAIVQARSKPIGPKTNYLTLGDSLAFGFQPDLDWDDGYANDLYADYKTQGTSRYTNLACPGESSITMIAGNCPLWFLHKAPYLGSQLSAAVHFLHTHPGEVSPVTLDIGANDLLPDIDSSTCAISSNWSNDLATMDANITGTILPELLSALTINGQVTGDVILLGLYDPFQQKCPATIPYVALVNAHLARDAAQVGNVLFADVFTAFGGINTTSATICADTWMCSLFHNIHATDAGYRLMAQTVEQVTGY
jgi:lysophospholipase L1-like esterase